MASILNLGDEEAEILSYNAEELKVLKELENSKDVFETGESIFDLSKFILKQKTDQYQELLHVLGIFACKKKLVQLEIENARLKNAVLTTALEMLAKWAQGFNNDFNIEKDINAEMKRLNFICSEEMARLVVSEDLSTTMETQRWLEFLSKEAEFQKNNIAYRPNEEQSKSNFLNNALGIISKNASSEETIVSFLKKKDTTYNEFATINVLKKYIDNVVTEKMIMSNNEPLLSDNTYPTWKIQVEKLESIRKLHFGESFIPMNIEENVQERFKFDILISLKKLSRFESSIKCAESLIGTCTYIISRLKPLLVDKGIYEASIDYRKSQIEMLAFHIRYSLTKYGSDTNTLYEEPNHLAENHNVSSSCDEHVSRNQELSTMKDNNLNFFKEMQDVYSVVFGYLFSDNINFFEQKDTVEFLYKNYLSNCISTDTANQGIYDTEDKAIVPDSGFKEFTGPYKINTNKKQLSRGNRMFDNRSRGRKKGSNGSLGKKIYCKKPPVNNHQNPADQMQVDDNEKPTFWGNKHSPALHESKVGELLLLSNNNNNNTGEQKQFIKNEFWDFLNQDMETITSFNTPGVYKEDYVINERMPTHLHNAPPKQISRRFDDISERARASHREAFEAIRKNQFALRITDCLDWTADYEYEVPYDICLNCEGVWKESGPPHVITDKTDAEIDRILKDHSLKWCVCTCYKCGKERIQCIRSIENNKMVCGGFFTEPPEDYETHYQNAAKKQDGPPFLEHSSISREEAVRIFPNTFLAIKSGSENVVNVRGHNYSVDVLKALRLITSRVVAQKMANTGTSCLYCSSCNLMLSGRNTNSDKACTCNQCINDYRGAPENESSKGKRKRNIRSAFVDYTIDWIQLFIPKDNKKRFSPGEKITISAYRILTFLARLMEDYTAGEVLNIKKKGNYKKKERYENDFYS